MNELQLSNDLTTISTEIKSYQSIGGQAIFEIGRRLKWVKENDLAHGEYIKWLGTINMDRTLANKFIKVSENIPNVATSQHLSMNVLYEIATMPEDERTKPQQLPNGEIKTPDEMTVRELRETKKRLAEAQDENIKKSQTIKDLQARPKETVEKEVIPKGYGDLTAAKQIISKLESQITDLNERLSKKELHDDDLAEQRKLERLKRDADMSGVELLYKGREFLKSYSLTNYTTKKVQDATDETKQELAELAQSLIEYGSQLQRVVNGRVILEGEIING